MPGTLGAPLARASHLNGRMHELSGQITAALASAVRSGSAAPRRLMTSTTTAAAPPAFGGPAGLQGAMQALVSIAAGGSSAAPASGAAAGAGATAGAGGAGAGASAGITLTQDRASAVQTAAWALLDLLTTTWLKLTRTEGVDAASGGEAATPAATRPMLGHASGAVGAARANAALKPLAPVFDVLFTELDSIAKPLTQAPATLAEAAREAATASNTTPAAGEVAGVATGAGFGGASPFGGGANAAPFGQNDPAFGGANAPAFGGNNAFGRANAPAFGGQNAFAFGGRNAAAFGGGGGGGFSFGTAPQAFNPGNAFNNSAAFGTASVGGFTGTMAPAAPRQRFTAALAAAPTGASTAFGAAAPASMSASMVGKVGARSMFGINSTNVDDSAAGLHASDFDIALTVKVRWGGCCVRGPRRCVLAHECRAFVRSRSST